MNILSLWILIIASLTACSCALFGCFLILRGVALMSDAISHAILPGIVIMFLLIGNLQSPLLVVGALLAGMSAVLLIEFLIQRTTLKKDAAISSVFPFFFSVGVILISTCTRNIHLDMDMVLLGDLVFAPFNRLCIATVDYGPCAFWTALFCLSGAIITLSLFYKQLVTTTFDPLYAHILGMHPGAIHYFFMTGTTVLIIQAFNTVGSIVVIALMLMPAATAYLCVQRLPELLLVSTVVSITSVVGGYYVAWCGDVSIAGSIACVGGIILCIALIISPNQGLYKHLLYRHEQVKITEQHIIDMYLMKYPYHTPEEIAQALCWPVKKVVRYYT